MHRDAARQLLVEDGHTRYFETTFLGIEDRLECGAFDLTIDGNDDIGYAMIFDDIQKLVAGADDGKAPVHFTALARVVINKADDYERGRVETAIDIDKRMSRLPGANQEHA